MFHIITCVWPRQIHCKWVDISIGSQSRFIVKKLQVTCDDVIMTSGHLEMMTGKICTSIIWDLIRRIPRKLLDGFYQKRRSEKEKDGK